MELNYSPHFDTSFPKGFHSAKGTQNRRNENQDVLDEASNTECKGVMVLCGVGKVTKDSSKVHVALSGEGKPCLSVCVTCVGFNYGEKNVSSFSKLTSGFTKKRNQAILYYHLQGDGFHMKIKNFIYI